jgi:transposase
MLGLCRFYQFQWRFCSTARDNEKGRMERSVEYIRGKVFALKDEFASLQVKSILKRMAEKSMLYMLEFLFNFYQHIVIEYSDAS